jgi:hypothetical protein
MFKLPRAFAAVKNKKRTCRLRAEVVELQRCFNRALGANG